MAMAPVALSSAEYVRHIRLAKAAGSIVILDNGTPYLGQSVPDAELNEAITLVGPDVVILPDVLNDSQATAARLRSFLDTYAAHLDVAFMGVIQGRTREEYSYIYREYMNDPCISHIGIPFMGASIDGLYFERARFLSALHDADLVYNTRSHHLLGLSHSGNIELRALSHFPFIRSCDTSAAYVHASLGLLLTSTAPYPKSAACIDFDAPFDQSVANLLLRNARCLDSCAS